MPVCITSDISLTPKAAALLDFKLIACQFERNQQVGKSGALSILLRGHCVGLHPKASRRARRIEGKDAGRVNGTRESAATLAARTVGASHEAVENGHDAVTRD